MLCSPRGMHPMDCRIACDLSAVRYHGIYRKLSGDMLGACASAMMVSDCPHGQDKRIIQRKVSPKMPPHAWCISAKSPSSKHLSTKTILWLCTCSRSTDQLSRRNRKSQTPARGRRVSPEGVRPRCPVPACTPRAGGRLSRNQAPLLQTDPDSLDESRSELS